MKNQINKYIFFLLQVKVICETLDWTHSMELKNKLKDTYSKVQFSEVPLAIDQQLMAQGKK